MKERPILFSGAMVRAILAGTKTQTRRIVKPQPASGAGLRVSVPQPANGGASVVFGAVDARGVWSDALRLQCPYGAAGDQLWVRETWAQHTVGGEVFTVYRADCGDDGDGAPWRPSIFMPRALSRISLEIAGVRVERVQQISEADARAEGVMIASDTVTPVTLYDKYADPATHVDAYADLWDSINGARGFGWDANPWVWVLEFRRAA